MLLPLGQSTVIGETLGQLEESPIFEKILVTGRDQEKVRKESLKAGKYIVVYNKNFSMGLTTSIQEGVRQASDECLGYMICLGDMSLVTSSEYEQLIHFFELERPQDSKLIVLPTHKGKKGNPVIFSSTYREQILNHKELNGCRKIIENSRAHVRKCDLQSDHVLVDIDTREDYQNVVKRFG